MKASFNTETLEGQVMISNAENEVSKPLKDMESGTIIEVNGIACVEGETEQYGSKQEVTVTYLFSTDSEIYSSISESVAKGADRVMELMMTNNLVPCKVRIKKAQNKNGQDFLTIGVVL